MLEWVRPCLICEIKPGVTFNSLAIEAKDLVPEAIMDFASLTFWLLSFLLTLLSFFELSAAFCFGVPT